MRPCWIALVGLAAVGGGLVQVLQGAPELRASETTAPLPTWPMYWLRQRMLDMLAEVRMPGGSYSQITGLAVAFWSSEVVHALSLHGVFDALGAAGGSTNCSDAASRTGLRAELLCRYMRAGDGIGVLREVSDAGDRGEIQVSRSFALTAHGELLRANSTGSLRDIALHLSRSPAEPPPGHEQASKAVAALTRLTAAALLGDWTPPSPRATACAAGPGASELVSAILERFGDVKGVALDFSPADAAAPRAGVKAAAAPGRALVLPGSLDGASLEKFSRCDVVVLPFLLQTFPEAEVLQFLKRLAATAPRGARLDLLEQVLGGGSAAATRRAALLDVLELLGGGGRVRTLGEVGELLATAGISGKVDLKPLRSQFSLLQVSL